ncbi:MAG TPA: deoxyguanosinetriphosphate triphosphohydrolase [Woeseiaceae bacterium]|nr:deoxyguanosinetriphosphate triphosphohydrolase [Woeseiaceae bacterium]
MSAAGLAPYAASEAASRGRRHPEPPSAWRGEYQRDRDRIIHSTAFRRLMYKTQVFVNHEGDLYRTRLTHSLEVAQIGRTVAVALRLSEPLTEAICLAHDLGHTPFGHAGQDALNACMRAWGGFEHNLQSLRVVDELEARYADFSGLNLMFETREGILKHCSARNARALGDLGARFIERRQPGLEAQIADIADAIAYNHHDVDDGLRAGLITLRQLRRQPLFAGHYEAVRGRWPALPDTDRRLVFEVIRRMIGSVVSDLISTSARNIESAAPATIDDVRAAPRPLIGMSRAMAERHVALKRFLNRHLYRHERKLAMTERVQAVVRDLFQSYMSDNTLMSEEFFLKARDLEDAARARVVADYIAGMTDRYAFDAHAALARRRAPRRTRARDNR